MNYICMPKLQYPHFTFLCICVHTIVYKIEAVKYSCTLPSNLFCINIRNCKHKASMKFSCEWTIRWTHFVCSYFCAHLDRLRNRQPDLTHTMYLLFIQSLSHPINFSQNRNVIAFLPTSKIKNLNYMCLQTISFLCYSRTMYLSLEV